MLSDENRIPQGEHWKIGTVGGRDSTESVCRGTVSGGGIIFGR